MLNPQLKGKPVAVGGSEENRHGIILANSEEAKKYGIKTGEALWQARKKCKDLIMFAIELRIMSISDRNFLK